MPKISTENDYPESWVCFFGNSPHYEGFHPCGGAPDYPYIEPIEGQWHVLYKCDRCGRVEGAI